MEFNEELLLERAVEIYRADTDLHRGLGSALISTLRKLKVSNPEMFIEEGCCATSSGLVKSPFADCAGATCGECLLLARPDLVRELQKRLVAPESQA